MKTLILLATILIGIVLFLITLRLLIAGVVILRALLQEIEIKRDVKRALEENIRRGRGQYVKKT